MLTPMKAIRAKCLDCCCGSSKEVELCPAPDCPLHSYRFGKNPNIKLSGEERARRSAAMKKYAETARQKNASKGVGYNDTSHTEGAEIAHELT